MKKLLIASTLLLSSSAVMASAMTDKIYRECGYPSPSQECIQKVLSGGLSRSVSLNNLPSIGLPEISKERFESIEFTKKLIDISGYDFFHSKLKQEYQENCSTGQYTPENVINCAIGATKKWYDTHPNEAASYKPASENTGSAFSLFLIIAVLIFFYNLFKSDDDAEYDDDEYYDENDAEYQD